MFDQLKYVIVEVLDCELPIIFSNLIDHDTFIGRRVISAGFVQTGAVGNAFEVNCFHESVSLGIKSRPEEDARIILGELTRVSEMEMTPGSEETFVTNFSVSDMPKYEVIIKQSGMNFWVSDEAFDIDGNPLKGFLSLHTSDRSSLTQFWRNFNELFGIFFKHFL